MCVGQMNSRCDVDSVQITHKNKITSFRRQIKKEQNEVRECVIMSGLSLLIPRGLG